MSAEDPVVNELAVFKLTGVQHGKNSGGMLFVDDVDGRLGFASRGSLPPFYLDADHEAELLRVLTRRAEARKSQGGT